MTGLLRGLWVGLKGQSSTYGQPMQRVILTWPVPITAPLSSSGKQRHKTFMWGRWKRETGKRGTGKPGTKSQGWKTRDHCHCSIKRLLNVSASTTYTDSCDCFANYVTNMNYNIRLTVISINCKNCPIGCPYDLFLRSPPLRFGAGFSSLAFSVAPFMFRRSYTDLGGGRADHWLIAFPPLNFGLTENCRRIYFLSEHLCPEIVSLHLKLKKPNGSIFENIRATLKFLASIIFSVGNFYCLSDNCSYLSSLFLTQDLITPLPDLSLPVQRIAVFEA